MVKKSELLLKNVSKKLSTIINLPLLLIVYIFGIGIVSLSMKLLGKHFLEFGEQNKQSNWLDHKVTKQRLEQYCRMF